MFTSLISNMYRPIYYVGYLASSRLAHSVNTVPENISNFIIAFSMGKSTLH